MMDEREILESQKANNKHLVFDVDKCFSRKKYTYLEMVEFLHCNP